MNKLQLFDQNHGLSPLQKYQFCLLFKSMFILSRKACFLTRTSPNTFSGCTLHKTKRKQNSHFAQNHGLTPLEKCQFCGFLKPMFSLFRKACLLHKTSKIVFFNTYFHDLWHGNTGGYKGLQGVTWGYRGLQEVTGGYKGWQAVTRGYREWQGVTWGNKGL